MAEKPVLSPEQISITIEGLMTTIHTHDLELRRLREDDVSEEYAKWLRDPEVNKYLEVRFSDTKLAALRSYVREVTADPCHHLFLVTHRDSGSPIGTASLRIIQDHNVASYGYLVGNKKHWGGTTAFQIQSALFDFGFIDLGLRRIYGECYATNVASRFNMKRMGFEQEGLLREHGIGADGEIIDVVVYGILRREWMDGKISQNT